jgi:serine/threonine protein kinase
VKITPNEPAKVLDFGLAKVMDPAAPAVSAAPAMNSPTLSMMATQAGVILGTAAYMSPEQIQGLAADARSDVFSFGSVLYEMLTGRQPFHGDTVAALLASVLVGEPDLGALPPHLNPRLPELLKRCLEKNPKRRWQAVGDLRAVIEAIAAAPLAVPAVTRPATTPRRLWRRAMPVAATAPLVAAHRQ